MFAAIRSLFNLGSKTGTTPMTAGRERAPAETESLLSNAANELGKTANDAVQTRPIQPVGAGLWESTLARWCQGEWEDLVRLDMNNIENETERAKLGLVVASAWLQLGDSAAARRYLRLALDWGCDKQLAAQILTAGVHNTLGRAAAIADDQARIEQHFRQAVAGSDSQIESASLGRRHVELHRLGLEQAGLGGFETARLLPVSDSGQPIPTLSVKDEEFLSLAEIGIESSDIALFKSRLPCQDLVNEQFDLHRKKTTESILIIFSTPRSGSTYLCNLLQANDLCCTHEYFQLEQYLPILAQRWGCIADNLIDRRKYIQSLFEMRTADNGWLGINLHSHHIKTFERFRKFLPESICIHYMHLIRRDTLAQAISFEIAEQTGQWTSFFKEKAEPIYNFPSISAKVKNISDGNFFINTYIRNNKLSCAEIYYEDLLGGMAPGIFEIFQRVDPLLKKSPTKKQSCDINEDWKIRFQSDLLLAV